jgi:hypothetical protein
MNTISHKIAHKFGQVRISPITYKSSMNEGSLRERLKTLVTDKIPSTINGESIGVGRALWRHKINITNNLKRDKAFKWYR